jgi:hypothetical protein
MIDGGPHGQVRLDAEPVQEHIDLVTAQGLIWIEDRHLALHDISVRVHRRKGRTRRVSGS